MNHSGSHRSPRMHKLIHKQFWHNPIIHPVLTSRVYLFVTRAFVLFLQILIDPYPLSREEFNNNSSSSHSKYSLMECTHVLSLMMSDKCGIDEDLYKNPLFSSNCTTWLIDMHPTWSMENILEVLHLVPLDLQFCHVQWHVRWHVNILHTHIH